VVINPKELMETSDLTLSGFQKHISEKYEKVDRSRGAPKTFLWFMEEVGELASALNSDDRTNLEEEFADVLAWLCTLANISDVNLAEAVARKYLGEKPPEGHK
jgi:NTP pyrophosphatase (non-canonical NTP hydrolase)